jgi:hypothetical protein
MLQERIALFREKRLARKVAPTLSAQTLASTTTPLGRGYQPATMRLFFTRYTCTTGRSVIAKWYTVAPTMITATMPLPLRGCFRSCCPVSLRAPRSNLCPSSSSSARLLRRLRLLAMTAVAYLQNTLLGTITSYQVSIAYVSSSPCNRYGKAAGSLDDTAAFLQATPTTSPERGRREQEQRRLLVKANREPLL